MLSRAALVRCFECYNSCLTKNLETRTGRSLAWISRKIGLTFIERLRKTLAFGAQAFAEPANLRARAIVFPRQAAAQPFYGKSANSSDVFYRRFYGVEKRVG